MLKFIGNREQKNALEGLAYRIADNSYMIERHGKDAARIELQENHKTIIGLFEKLDQLKVPFWVQNTVIFYFEDWRRYKTEYFSSAMEKKNIYFV